MIGVSMQTPPAGIIEIAVEELKTVDKKHLNKQISELRIASGAMLTDESFEDGYNLGIQTARVMLNVNVELQMKDIKVSDLL